MELKLGQNGSRIEDGDSHGHGDIDAGYAQQAARISRTNAAVGSGPALTIPPDATRITPVDGRVQLPAGTRLDAIRAVGTDLVVTLPDGEVLVIVDGALRMPQLMIGTITIPLANVAALLAGQEPEPAAGPPQSSGGNFDEPVGDIGDPFGLGDLLPPTDFGFAAAEEREFIPAVADNEPEILIITPDQPAGAISATASVSESALPARGSEPAGSDSASTAESVSGTIQIVALDQPSIVAINGIAVTAVGQTITSPLGLITITSIAPGAIGYSYTLTDNSTNPDARDVVTITVTDRDGDTATGTLTLTVLDDAPIARADVENVAPKTYTAQTGNVLTGLGTASGAAGADTQGADGARVTGIRSATESSFTAAGTVIEGQYGRLLIQPDGSYSYTRNAGSPGGVADVFTYQLTDGDGDVATATLTVNIADSGVGLIVPLAGDDGTRVDEAGLSEREGGAPGSRAGDGSDITAGVVLFDAPDGPATITVNGVTLTGGDQEIELPTGTLYIIGLTNGSFEYVFLLTQNVGATPIAQPITITVTDRDGDSSTATFNIDIADDAPRAVADTDSVAAGTYGPVTGNVITDAENDGGADVQGADGARVSAVAGAGGTALPGAPLAGLYGVLTLNGDGSYSYVRNPGTPGGVADTFTYTLRDGDGDVSTATLTVTIRDSGVTVVVPNGAGDGQKVAEAGLPEGSAAGNGSSATTGTISFAAADGPARVTIGGVEVTAVGQSFVGVYGTLTITSIAPGKIGYAYVLTKAADGDAVSEQFAIRVTDADGDAANGSLKIDIVDDVPSAQDDSDDVDAGSPSAIADGNVLTGIGGSDANDSDGKADVQGADGAIVTAVSFAGNTGTLGEGTAGAYGTLILNSDGSYRYVLDVENPDIVALDSDDSLTETFEYEITDADGDPATASLTITVKGRDDGVTISGLNPEGAELSLNEANLADGSAPDPAALTHSGEFSFDAPDGLVTLTIGGAAVFDGDIVDGATVTTDHGILTITAFDPLYDGNGEVIGGTIRYNYELTDNLLLHGGANDAALTESFAIVITDSDGTIANDSLDVRIIDDVPVAAADSGSAGEGQTLAVDADAGLLANDVAGADEVQIAGVRAAGGNLTAAASGGVGTAVAGLYGTLTVAADGSYSYAANPNAVPAAGASDIFVYTLRDGDGDLSTTTLTISLTDSGLSATAETAVANEAALSDGSDPDSDAETVEGDLNANVSGGDGPYSFALVGNGVGNHGVLTLNADGSYSYTLAAPIAGTSANNGANTVGGAESFTYIVTDASGNSTQNTITIDIVDDVPVAAADSGSTGEGQTLAVDADAGLLANDVAGADEVQIAGVRAAGGNLTAAASGGVGAAVAGLYGTLTVAADGSYSYAANPNVVPAAGASDIFVYTLRDGDGDLSTTTLTISMTDSGLSATAETAVANEAALSDGSDPDSDAETVEGDLNANVSGGDGPYSFALVGNGVGNHGVLTLNADGSYSYTLAAPIAGTSANNGANTVGGAESFTYIVTDAFGNSTQNTITIDIVDDVPVARPDPAIVIAEDAPTVSGDLLANDSPGADGASVTSVTVNGVTIAIAASGTTLHSNAFGTYTFEASGAWSFDPKPSSSATALNAGFTYEITDGDGDKATAAQAISLVDGQDPRASAPITLTLDDQNLLEGSTPNVSPSFPLPVTSGTISFTAGSDPIVSIGFGDLAGLGGGLTWTFDSPTTIIGWYTDIPIVQLDLVVVGLTATVTATLLTNYPFHGDITADDLAAMGFAKVVATDSDGDSVIGRINVGISDDVPTISGRAVAAGLLSADESNLAQDATANFQALFNIVKGADQPATMAYSFAVNPVSGLTDVATGGSILLFASGNVVEGRVGGMMGPVAFRLTIDANGVATLDQLRAIRHADPSNPDDAATMTAMRISLTATVTDSEGDKASATVDVGHTLIFRDDGPSIDVSSTDGNILLLTTQDADTIGAATDTASASFASAFTLAAMTYGADGAPSGASVSWTYALLLGAGASVTGLTSNGVPITLALVGGAIVGNAGSAQVFSITVDPATGVVTLTQFAELDHPLPGASASYADQLLALPAGLVELRATALITDRDGDSISDSATIDLGGNIRFADDGPSVSATGSAPLLEVDETTLAANASGSFAGLFAPDLSYGADGPGTIAYELGVTAGPTGLFDSLTGEAVTLSLVGGVILGRTSSQEVFRISVDAAGVVTFDQSRAVRHSPDSGPDQSISFTGSNLITLTAIVTDGDGDTARTTVDISGRFAIRDDAPLASADNDNVARDGEIFADGNVLTGVGGVDGNGVDGVADSAGNDGGLRVTGIAYGSTAGTLGTALAGNYGSIIVAADGSYRYELDIADPDVIALKASETLTETFSYTVADSDGDTSTATITITITGANDFPVARADTNWVLDGPSGSDPATTGNVLQNISHPGAPSGTFADVADTDPDLEVLTVTTAGTYVGLYGTLVIAANGAYTYTLNEDNAAVNALDSGQTLSESFGYTVTDGALSVSSSLTITVFGTNDAPTVGSSIARISEEGLAGANPDTAPNATLDTTNSASFSGVLAIADVDTGETLTATLGNPGAVLTVGGVPVSWSGVGTTTLIGSVGGNEVIRVTLAANGAYSVTLSKAVDHADGLIEDLREFMVPVSVSDGTVTTTNASAIRIVIEDDAPRAFGESGSSTQPAQDVNSLFILDFSDSIDAGELDTMLDAVKNALTLLDNAALGQLNIKFVIFSSGSFASPNFTTAAAANAYLDSLNPVDGGTRPDTIGLNTNYTGAIQTALANWSAIPGASNQVFFLSDGNPNQQTQFGGVPPTVVNSLLNATATAWNNYIDGNNVNVTVIGVDNNPLQPLNLQRLADVDVNSAPDNVPILVDSFSALVATLISVVVPTQVGGDLDANDFYGADGGRLLSITIGAVTYTWDGGSTISLSSGGTISGTTLSNILTPMGGALTLNFATGQYSYQPPSPITVTATEIFNYTIVDADGDRASAALSVTITAAAPPVVLDLDGDGVEFVSSAAGVRFDYDGDGRAELTAWVGRDDGLLVLDRNGDGQINDGTELVFAENGLTDLQGLAANYDSNGDGQFDASDAEYGRFGVWRDANGNGVTDPGELQTLAEAGIVSIGLVSDNRGYVTADGQVIVRGEALYVRTDGSAARLADAAFATNFANDTQRSLLSGSNAVSAGLVAAGLVATLPLAAADLAEKPPSDASAMGIAQAVEAIEPVVETPSAIEGDHGELWLGDFLVDRTVADHGVAEPRHVLAGATDDHATDFDAASQLHSGMPMVEAIEPDVAPVVPLASVQGPFAAAVDQTLMLAPEARVAVQVENVGAIVTNALEGQMVDLDALLGPQEMPSTATPLLEGIGGGEMAIANPAIFIPEFMQVQIAAQMEHAAATGHA